MNYCYITGSSKGLGKAIAEAFLKKSYNVIGVSRSQSIEHKNYTHVNLDLGDLENVKTFEFEEPDNADKLVLINNAGTLGHVGHLGNLSDDKTIQAYHVNLIAPHILMNNFIRKFRDHSAQKIIINVTSGAAQHAVDGWSAYCSTKAGIDMLSRVAAREQEIDEPEHPFRIFSIAPGVVDTQMQTEIRQTDKKGFSRVEEFKRKKAENELVDPESVAEKYIHVAEHSDNFDDVILSVRDMSVSG